MLGVVFNDGKIGNLYIVSAHGRRLKDWWPRDKASRKVAKKGQPGGRQEAGKAILCKAEQGGGFPAMPLWRCLLGMGAKKLLVVQAGTCPEVSLRDGGSQGLKRMR